MRVFPFGIKHPLDVPVQRSHDAMRASIVGPSQIATTVGLPDLATASLAP